MFAIYNIQGRRFRDNLEKLQKVRQVNENEQARFHENVAQDETLVIQGASAQDRLEMQSAKGVQAYRDQLHLNQRAPIYHVHQLMSHPVVTIRLDTPLEEAHRHFQAHGFNQMPVLDPQHKLVGMVTVQGLLRLMTIDQDEVRYLTGKSVADAMSSEVITADPVSDVRRVAKVMVEYHLDGLPIVNEHDHLVGMVTRSDIMRAVMNDPPLSLWT